MQRQIDLHDGLSGGRFVARGSEGVCSIWHRGGTKESVGLRRLYYKGTRSELICDIVTP